MICIDQFILIYTKYISHEKKTNPFLWNGKVCVSWFLNEHENQIYKGVHFDFP